MVSGFCSAWLGVGGSVFIIPFLPFLSGLSAFASLQVSLLLIVTISFVNSLSFALQKLVLWNRLIKAGLLALSFAFLSGIFVSHLNSLQIRFILWLFLAIIFSLPWLLTHKPVLKNRKGFYLFSSLMGVCSSLTGLGGGMILSPFLHESEHIPAKNIPALVSCIMLFVSSFSLLGQFSQTGLVFAESSDGLFIYLLLLLPAFAGLLIGYVANVKQKNIKLRRLLLRIAVTVIFLKMTIELFVQILR